MQAKQSLEFYFGAKDWQHESWLGSFYPDDIPQDWQFSYYNNEFQCVLLDARRLHEIDEDQIADWLEDIAEPFSFFLELEADTQWQQVEPVIRTLAGYFGGVVLRSAGTVQQATLEAFEKLLQQLSAICAELSLSDPTIVMDTPEVTSQLQEWLCSHGINTCWYPKAGPGQWLGGTTLVAMIGHQGSVVPTELRQWLESILEYVRHNNKASVTDSDKTGALESVVVFFVGSEPDAESIKKADMIAQMLQ